MVLTKTSLPSRNFVFKYPISAGCSTVCEGARFRVSADGATRWECLIDQKNDCGFRSLTLLGGAEGFDADDPATYKDLLFSQTFEVRPGAKVVDSRAPSQNAFAPGVTPTECYERLTVLFVSCSC